MSTDRPDKYGGASIAINGKSGSVEIEIDVCTKSYSESENHTLCDLVDGAIKAYEVLKNDTE